MLPWTPHGFEFRNQPNDMCVVQVLVVEQGLTCDSLQNWFKT